MKLSSESYVKEQLMTPELNVISTGRQPLDTLVRRAEKIHPYIDAIHIREKTWTANEMVIAIEMLRSKGVPRKKIVVNDRVDVAHVMNIRGVQLAHHSIAVERVRNAYNHLEIGCSVHDSRGAIAAEKNGADRLIFGHVFDTHSKPGLPPKGMECMKEIVSNVSIPVIAIGGITPDNAADVIAAGASGIAVLSGVMLADDEVKAVTNYRDAIQRKKGDYDGKI
ncbi:thiazole tautomerase TenI [Virgibacillus necropolis]|uniref:thiazole tautomerase TenI n=1 Tax=Virgibacillus necropolis TaxID=163877 RepID=UPI00384AC542